MNNGPDNVTSTVSNEPPAFLRGPLQAATSAAQQQFNSSQYGGQGVQPGGQYGGGRLGRQPIGRQPGGPVAPPGGGKGNPGGSTVTPGMAPGGNPNDLIGQAQNLTSQTIGGQFLSPDTNPYLQGTFNRAADLTQTRLASQFAGAGRNQGAAYPARSDELQTLASNIFGGNYERERGIQANSLADAQSLDPLNQFINRLAGIIPGAGGTSTSQQPVFKTGLF